AMMKHPFFQLIFASLFCLIINPLTAQDKVEYYDNGAKKVAGKIVDGRKTGVWEEWYSNGNLKSITNYNKNTIQIFSEDGKKIAEGNLTNDIRNGKWTVFYNNGAVKEKSVYKNGKLNGKKETFYRSGQKASES